jgi:hypothetical protein
MLFDGLRKPSQPGTCPLLVRRLVSGVSKGYGVDPDPPTRSPSVTTLETKWSRLGLQAPSTGACRYACQRLRLASAMRRVPSGARGPVLLPPWNLQRPFGIEGAWQGESRRVFAPHLTCSAKNGVV